MDKRVNSFLAAAISEVDRITIHKSERAHSSNRVSQSQATVYVRYFGSSDKLSLKRLFVTRSTTSHSITRTGLLRLLAKRFKTNT